AELAARWAEPAAEQSIATASTTSATRIDWPGSTTRTSRRSPAQPPALEVATSGPSGANTYAAQPMYLTSVSNAKHQRHRPGPLPDRGLAAVARAAHARWPALWRFAYAPPWVGRGRAQVIANNVLVPFAAAAGLPDAAAELYERLPGEPSNRV